MQKSDLDRQDGWEAAALGCFCTVYILLFCWLGLYSFPSTPYMEDYAYSYNIAKWGFWPFQRIHYVLAEGRLLNCWLMSLFALMPIEAYYPYFPTLTIFLYAAAVYVLTGVAAPQTSLRQRGVWSLAVTAVTLSFLYSCPETLYWVVGMPYIWQMALFFLALSLALRAFRTGRFGLDFFLCLMVLFGNGTLLETGAVVQGVVAFLLALGSLRRGDRRRAAMAASFWFISVVAFLVVYLSPGTAIRMGENLRIPFLMRVGRTLGLSALGTFQSLVRFFLHPVVYVFFLFLPGIVENVKLFSGRAVSRLKPWHSVPAIAFWAFLMNIMGVWSLGALLSPRMETLSMWLMAVAWFFFWTFCCRPEALLSRVRASRFFARRWLLLALCLIVSTNFTDLLGDLAIAPDYAAENRLREEVIAQQKAKGEKRAVVPLLTAKPRLLLFSDLLPDTASNVRLIYALYHGLDTVKAVPRLIYDDSELLAQRLGGSPVPLERAAAAGDAVAMSLLGDYYAPIDRPRAMEWYQQAADHGHDPARLKLARLYVRREEYGPAFCLAFRSFLGTLRL